ncbi:Protein MICRORCHIDIA 6 [Linum perenne]
MRAVIYEPVRLESQGQFSQRVEQIYQHEYKTQSGRQEPEETIRPDTLNTVHTGSSRLEQEQSPLDDTNICSTTALRSTPVCRQFWKAGNYYGDTHCSKATLQNGKNYLHVHPMFLHSNATSHKWAFGAIAELLDNAIDEIKEGATYVIVDKVSNPRDGGSALLIQDDGGGMDPEAIRRCLSFGFSEKKFAGAIGQYGNGFKTSSMRLGADVIIFTRHMKDWTATQSIGLLSYSFLMKMGHDRIIVPMVDYEFNTKTNLLGISSVQTKESFKTNLSLLTQWSPYNTEAELLKQFDDIGLHGTKVVIYNLWFNDDENLELDFVTDLQDIRIEGGTRQVRKVNEQHLANRIHYSLHAYLSILYLRVPETFRMILRGQVVRPYNLADDLKFEEYILYKPKVGGSSENVITTIGFVKDAPRVSIHGFNIYHKNRLIKPFMQVVEGSTNSRSRGVAGILEANFIEPTHNKQDFERTSLFQKLEVRLKEMTIEYWEKRCGLIGYHVTKKVREVNPPCNSPGIPQTCQTNSVRSNELFPNRTAVGASSSGVKRKKQDNSVGTGSNKKLPRTRGSSDASPSNCGQIAPGDDAVTDQQQNGVGDLMQDKAKLLVQLDKYEKGKEELQAKVMRLRKELEELNGEYDQMMAEVTLLDAGKLDYWNVNM